MTECRAALHAPWRSSAASLSSACSTCLRRGCPHATLSRPPCWPASTCAHLTERDRAQSRQVDASGEIVALDGHCPWKSHLYDIEAELSTPAAPVCIKYVLYADEKGNWRVQCVSESEVRVSAAAPPISLPQSSFKNRLSLPEPWRGVRDDAVCVQLTGVWVTLAAVGAVGHSRLHFRTRLRLHRRLQDQGDSPMKLCLRSRPAGGGPGAGARGAGHTCVAFQALPCFFTKRACRRTARSRVMPRTCAALSFYRSWGHRLS